MRTRQLKSRLSSFARTHHLFSLVLIAVLVLLLIPMGFIIGFYSKNLMDTVTDFTIQQSRSTLNQLKNTVTMQMSEVSISFSAMSLDPRFATAVNEFQTSGTVSERLSATRDLNAIVDSHLSYVSENVRSVIVIDPGGPIYHYRYRPDLAQSIASGTGVFGLAGDQPDRLFFAGVESVRDLELDEDLVMMVIRPSREFGYSGTNFVVLSLYPNLFEDMLIQTRQNRSAVYILDDAGRSVIRPRGGISALTAAESLALRGVSGSEPGHGTVTIGGERSLVTVESNPRGWLFVEAIPLAVMEDRIFGVAGRVVLTAIALYALFSLAFVAMLRYQFRPLNLLAAHMKSPERGELVAYEGPLGARETTQLANSYNDMTLRIRGLIEEVRVTENQRRELEIEALLARINPHFVINTLNCIRIMAKLNREPVLERMLNTMCRLLTKSFSSGDSLASVGAELEFLQDYVEIMKLRYGDSFDYEANAPEELRDRLVPKFLLQPLVENAIVHGIAKRNGRGRGRIEIEFESNGERLIARVSDNGAGIDSSGEAASPRAPHFGIGLRSIKDRLRYQYGDDGSMEIQSRTGRGTSITLDLPPVAENE